MRKALSVPTFCLLIAGSAHGALPEHRNPLGMTFVALPSGTTQVGCAEGASVERPERTVILEKGFWMQTTEVTRAQWKALMGTEQWHEYDTFAKVGDDYAATFVSFEQAQAFAARLSEKDPQFTYRLPSEAEWEYACKAGGSAQSYGERNAVAWHGGNAYHGGEKFTHRVAQKVPNAWGLYDMLGNTWEWVTDTWHRDHTGHTGAGPRTGGDPTQRVLKGGSWRSGPDTIRAAARNYMTRTEFAGDLGFRLVMVPRSK